MHIPPYYKRPGWQRFFVGTMIGAIISYLVFIFMYGMMYEQLLEENLSLRAEVTEVKNQNKALLADNEDLDERAKKIITIDSIDLTIINADELRLDQLLIHQLNELMKAEIDPVIGKDLLAIAESDELIEATIENKLYKINDITYTFKVRKLVIAKRIKIYLEGSID